VTASRQIPVIKQPPARGVSGRGPTVSFRGRGFAAEVAASLPTSRLRCRPRGYAADLAATLPTSRLRRRPRGYAA
jgi:hypothetical protein